MLLFGALALLIYLFKTRGFKKGIIAIGLFLFLILGVIE
jgi:hypothetical protein